MSNFEGFMVIGLIALCFTRFSGVTIASAVLGAGITYFFFAKDNPALNGAPLWSTWVWSSYAVLAAIGLFCYLFMNNNGQPTIGSGGDNGPRDF